MVKHAFAHIRHWVFDLDNTLYPPKARLFDQIETKMAQYMMDVLGVDRQTADHLRSTYWREHGTTLAGLMTHHQIDPLPYLDAVHDISLDHLEIDHDLAAYIDDLPGKRIVYTNGSAPYARRVLKARGLDQVFDEVYGVEHAEYHPKPKRRAFEHVFAQAEIETRSAAMFEDDPRNLAAPHEMGMRTVHVAPDAAPAPHIHHHTDDLTRFLQLLQ